MLSSDSHPRLPPSTSPSTAHAPTPHLVGEGGSGKTYTLFGPDTTSDARGLAPRIGEAIFGVISRSDAATEFTVRVTFVEVVRNEANDLLDTTRRNLRVAQQDDGTAKVEGALQEGVSSLSSFLDLVDMGTIAHQEEGHTLFEVKVTAREPDGSSQMGRITLVDFSSSDTARVNSSQRRKMNLLTRNKHAHKERQSIKPAHEDTSTQTMHACMRQMCART